MIMIVGIYVSVTGKLVLSLVKDTYEQLGLQGSPSRYQKQHRYGNF